MSIGRGGAAAGLVWAAGLAWTAGAAAQDAGRDGAAGEPIDGVALAEIVIDGDAVVPVTPLDVARLEGSVRFTAFSEAVALSEIVSYVAEALEINVTAPAGGVPGEVVFNAPVEVPRSRLLKLLESLLQQQGHGITYDPTSGFYSIAPRDQVPRVFGDELPTVKVIRVPYIRPTSIQPAVERMVGNAQAVNFLDDLGVIVVTDTAKQIALVEEFVDEMVSGYLETPLHEIALKNVAASVARQRIVELAGGGSSRARPGLPQRQGGNQDAGGSVGSEAESLAARLTAAPQGNSLLFRGTSDELVQIRRYVEIIDRADTLLVKRYFVGRSARNIAGLARGRGLGEVVELSETSGQTGLGAARGQAGQVNALQLGSGDSAVSLGGPTMVVDIENGVIVYYGTPEQHELVATLVDQFSTQDDVPVIRTYRLNNAQALEVATIIDAILNEQNPVNDGSPLLPTASNARTQPGFDASGSGAGGVSRAELGANEIGEFDAEESFVVADEANNQIVVKAPRAQQRDFELLIRKLDLRREQVYIQATILSLTNSDDFRLAVESQLQIGVAEVRSNFGLSGPQATITDNVDPSTGLSGITTAVLLDSFTPVIINAIQDTTDAKILSRPSLLVNDNEEAQIVALAEQPTATTSQGDGATITSFQDFQEAGTRLLVTPTISEAGFMQLQYEVELSDFVGAPTDTLPSPRATNEVSGVVTVPSDATIVVGGIVVDSEAETVAKIPFIGDIPIVGNLFRDTSTEREDTLLYIFITARIMSDPNFADLKLLSEGPKEFLDEKDAGFPRVEPIMMEFFSERTARRLEELPASDDFEPWRPSIPSVDAERFPPLAPGGEAGGGSVSGSGGGAGGAAPVTGAGASAGF